MQDYIGKNIDRYRIIERLGMGGMAVVYKAYDTRLEREVAVKLIRTDEIPASQHDRLMKRFEREARAQARFTHPNIVPAYDYGEFESTPYMVLAYLAGGTLKNRMSGVMQIPEALELVMAIADAVAYAHGMGVLHRDIKPSNILFSKEDIPMLTDFGIAKMLETTDVTLTGTGLGVGTPEYMAPEQWQGKAMEASDQYALGVVLYELLTGEKPYTAETPLAVALKVMNDPLRHPRDLNPAIPEAVEMLLFKTLAREPRDRYADILAFRIALEAQLALILPEPNISVIETRPEPGTQVEELAHAQKSEAETIDGLTPTPIEPKPKPLSHQTDISPQIKNPSKVTLPAWAMWMGGLAIVVLLMTAGISMVGGERNQKPTPTNALTEVVMSLVETPAHTATDSPAPILTEVPELTSSTTNTPIPSPTLETTLGIGSMMVNPIDGADMVYVPEGEFLMGPEGTTRVFLDAYWIYQYEVTNLKYQLCVDEGGCNLPGIAMYFNDQSYQEHPVENISWFDAHTYCQWSGGRLPTEAEWEKAARGTDGRKYPWGNDTPTCSHANFLGCVGGHQLDRTLIYGLMPVGSYPEGASPYGSLDMAGNAWEWVNDWNDESFYSNPDYHNPRGPDTGLTKVLRGGSWGNPDYRLCTYCRIAIEPSNIFYGGFRCVQDITN